MKKILFFLLIPFAGWGQITSDSVYMVNNVTSLLVADSTYRVGFYFVDSSTRVFEIEVEYKYYEYTDGVKTKEETRFIKQPLDPKDLKKTFFNSTVMGYIQVLINEEKKKNKIK